MKHVDIYSDGSARGNPGNGGYGALLLYTDSKGTTHESRLSCGYELTTNNRMELLGVITALERLKEPCEITVHTDSQYICNAFKNRWIDAWQKRGWKKTKGEPVKNVDLWKRLLRAMEPHRVTYEWVRGHAGNELNEQCDAMATSAADGDALEIDRGYLDAAQTSLDLPSSSI